LVSDYQTGRLNDLSTSIVGVGQNQIGIDAQASTFLVLHRWSGWYIGRTFHTSNDRIGEGLFTAWRGTSTRVFLAKDAAMERSRLSSSHTSLTQRRCVTSAGVARVVCSMGVVEPCRVAAELGSDGGRFKIDPDQASSLIRVSRQTAHLLIVNRFEPDSGILGDGPCHSPCRQSGSVGHEIFCSCTAYDDFSLGVSRSC
jgi:hypothetical protein